MRRPWRRAQGDGLQEAGSGNFWTGRECRLVSGCKSCWRWRRSTVLVRARSLERSVAQIERCCVAAFGALPLYIGRPRAALRSSLCPGLACDWAFGPPRGDFEVKTPPRGDRSQARLRRSPARQSGEHWVIQLRRRTHNRQSTMHTGGDGAKEAGHDARDAGHKRREARQDAQGSMGMTLSRSRTTRRMQRMTHNWRRMTDRRRVVTRRQFTFEVGPRVARGKQLWRAALRRKRACGRSSRCTSHTFRFVQSRRSWSSQVGKHRVRKTPLLMPVCGAWLRGGCGQARGSRQFAHCHQLFAVSLLIGGYQVLTSYA